MWYYRHIPMLPQPPLSSAVSNLQIRASPKFYESRLRKPQSVPAPFLVGIELNPGPPNLTEKQRWRIVFIRREEGRTPTDIAKKVGCTRHSVYSVLKKEKTTGTVHDQPKSGRKRKLTEEEKEVVKRAQKVGAVQTAREFSSKRSKNSMRGLFVGL